MAAMISIGHFLVNLFDTRLGAGLRLGAQGREVQGLAIFDSQWPSGRGQLLRLP